ncbi:polysaccharide deacetylase family protein [Streptantibioticus ferralitis]|uniref:Polysaccharide deacetylase family protein n=1 Tax=Streptantibioticus ferralitis TaxID=236510 RepID=A0ABT5YWX1_9ACTN|nr:polysaccharide deacetylase family protein [Streptantibioticus ferralitis]MDF2255811.1 polysaccharide deacetylase family protein [Streptantibioticus ferralitis]
MSIDRRSVLRAAMQTAAAGALTAGCAGSGPNSSSPRSAAPSGASVSRSPAVSGGGPAPLPAGLPGQITHGPRDRGMVALTFHGQGEPKLAETLLGEAERAGARVTVLAVGSWLDSYPQMARRVLDGGHELGNHTQNHRGISAMPADQASAEITQCADRLRKLTGDIGRWFRPSQTQYATPLVQRLAGAAGYRHVLSYDVDSLDYTDPGADAVRRTVLDQARHGSVVSLHFGHAGTVEALPALLDGLKQRGLRAVTTSELLT